MDKVALVTGATGGLGPAVVETLLKKGIKTVISYTTDQKYQKLVDQMKNLSNMLGIRADLTNEVEVKELFDGIIDKHGRLDALCHLTGGFWMGGDISETSLDHWNKMMNLNLLTTFLCTREAFRIMKEQKQGHIITVSARTALELPAGMGAYSISKSAVLALTDLLAKEVKEHNITVNAILPSTIDTDANRKSMPKSDFDKWVKPAEIANTILRLINDEVTGISGTAIKMYGKV